jgi:CelD/BcsL family acetyltransferase involved in cellulose biosynthesis
MTTVAPDNGAIAIETIADPDAFAALAPQWDPLVLAMPRPSPFLLHGWLSAWWSHHGTPGGLRVHVARRRGRLEAALPLCVRRRAGLRVTTFMGGDASALADVLLADGADPSLAGALAARATAAGGDLADLFGLPGGSRLAAALAPGALTLVPRAQAPVLDLEPGWEQVYRAKTSRKRRSLHGRRRRQLAELGDLRVEVARTRDELAGALEEAFELHELRWRDRPEASGFATPAGRAFHRAALRAIPGVPRILLMRVDGRAVACNYFFLLGGRMYFHELAFDPGFARVSPGQVATLEALAAAADEGARRVEFLGGTERYKLELADRLEPLYEGVGMARTLPGRAAASARVAALDLRRALKRTAARRVYYDHLAPVHRALRRLRT